VTNWAVYTSGTTASRFGGMVLLNTLVRTSAVAGDLVLANANKIRGVKADGSDTIELLQLASDNNLYVGFGAPGVSIGKVGGLLSFFGVSPAYPKISVTGSRGGNAALASLITALANYGLLTDLTT
jgi:hypothetical protein